MKQPIIAAIKLDPVQLTAVKNLYDSSQKLDGYPSQCYWQCLESRETTIQKDFLYYVDKQLVGYFGLFEFNADELEICTLVHPAHRQQHIFKRLFEFSYPTLLQLEVKSILFPCHESATDPLVWLKKHKAELDHTEYTLYLSLRHWSPVSDISFALTLKAATQQDIETMALMDVACFETAYPEMLDRQQRFSGQSNRQAYLAVKNNEVIGKIHIHFTNQIAVIHDLCIMPHAQHQGNGSQMLQQTLQILQKQGVRQVSIEVIAHNKRALTLYEKCLFKVSDAFAYWRLAYPFK